MEKLNPRDKRVVVTNLLVAVLLIAVLGILLNLVKNVDEESFQCIQDPLGYGATKIKEKNNAEFACTCSLDKVGSPIIFFDSKHKELIYPDVGQFARDAYKKLNLTALGIGT